MSTLSDPLLLTGLPVLIPDVTVSAPIIKDRRARGADLFDEVWDGVYVMAPVPNDEHQDIALGLASVVHEVIQVAKLGKVRPPINLASSARDWGRDYRIPDLAVFLNGSPSICHGAFWTGAPDFLVEIVSPYDQTREKLGFYERIGTRELLIIDRDPWQLELLRLDAGKLASVGDSTLEAPHSLASERTQLAFKLIPGAERPQMAVEHTGDGRTWTI
jgi:Uma2 family endonuclease